MNRRHFLSAIAAAVAGANYDPERALWTPGKKLISIPKLPFISNWALENCVDTLKAGDVFTISGVYALNPRTLKIGDTIQVRRPTRFAFPDSRHTRTRYRRRAGSQGYQNVGFIPNSNDS